MEFEKEGSEIQVKGKGEMAIALRYPNFRALMATLGRLAEKYNGGRVPLAEVILKEIGSVEVLEPSFN